jgi:hypothetical protein
MATTASAGAQTVDDDYAACEAKGGLAVFTNHTPALGTTVEIWHYTESDETWICVRAASETPAANVGKRIILPIETEEVNELVDLFWSVLGRVHQHPTCPAAENQLPGPHPLIDNVPSLGYIDVYFDGEELQVCSPNDSIVNLGIRLQ